MCIRPGPIPVYPCAMPRRMTTVLCPTALAAISMVAPAAMAEGVHFTYLWHLEQPIYWPDQQAGGADRTRNHTRRCGNRAP